MIACIFAFLFGVQAAIAGEADDAFAVAVQLLAQRYPEQMNDGDFYRAAISGMAAHVDEITRTSGSGVLTVREWADLQNRQRGERAGIGVQFAVLAGQGVVVDHVFAGSPAEKAGIESGDLIVGLNDRPFIGQSASTILSQVQQVSGPKVVLDLRRQGAPVRTVTVPWGTYWLDAVAPCGEGTVQCLEVQQFGAGTSAALAQAMKGMNQSEGLILDLRTNDDGLMEEMVASADLFLNTGDVVAQTLQPDGGTTPLTATTAGRWGGHVVLVVDEGTMGLSEAFAATLREHIQAKLVGTHTAGEGTIDSFYPLSDTLVLRLADVRLRSPAGRSWAAGGLAPDLLVQHPEMVLPTNSAGAIPDLQLEAAIRLLRSL